MPIIPFDYPPFEFNVLSATLSIAPALLLGVAVVSLILLGIDISRKRSTINTPLFVAIVCVSLLGSAVTFFFISSLPEDARGGLETQHIAWSKGYATATGEWRDHVAVELSKAYNLPIDPGVVEAMGYPRGLSDHNQRLYGPVVVLESGESFVLGIQGSTTDLYEQTDNGLKKIQPLPQNEIGKVRPWR